MCDQNCREASLSYRITNPILAGVRVLDNAANPSFRIVTVFNDTDVDIRVTYVNSEGDSGQFDVPKSIRTFTKALKVGTFTVATVKVAGITADAVGIVTFNFAT